MLDPAANSVIYKKKKNPCFYASYYLRGEVSWGGGKYLALSLFMMLLLEGNFDYLFDEMNSELLAFLNR